MPHVPLPLLLCFRLASVLVQMSHLMCAQGDATAAVSLLDAQFAQHEGMMDRSVDLNNAYVTAMRLSASGVGGVDTQKVVRSPLPIQWKRPKDEL